MGFTLAHPGAVVPIWLLARRRIPLPALVIGALSPDFEYLLRLAPYGDAGHDLAGIFLFCLPLSLVVLVVFETIVRAPMTDLLALPSRFAGSPSRTPAWWSSAAFGIVIGAATHAGWDALTHGDAWISAFLPARDGRSKLLYDLIGSGLGFAMLSAGLAASRDARAAAAAIARSPRRLATIAGLLALALLGAVANGVVGTLPPARGSALRFLAYAAVGGMAAIAAAVLGYSLCERFAGRWREVAARTGGRPGAIPRRPRGEKKRAGASSGSFRTV